MNEFFIQVQVVKELSPLIEENFLLITWTRMSFLIKYFKVFIFSSIPVYSSIIILNTKFRIDNIVRTYFLQILSLKFYPCCHYYYYLSHH